MDHDLLKSRAGHEAHQPKGDTMKIEKFSANTPVVMGGLAGYVLLVASQTQRCLADMTLSFEMSGEDLTNYVLGSYVTLLEHATGELDDALGQSDEALMAWFKRCLRRHNGELREDDPKKIKQNGWRAAEWYGWLRPDGEFAERTEPGAAEAIKHHEAAMKVAEDLTRIPRRDFYAVAKVVKQPLREAKAREAARDERADRWWKARKARLEAKKAKAEAREAKKYVPAGRLMPDLYLLHSRAPKEEKKLTAEFTKRLAEVTASLKAPPGAKRPEPSPKVSHAAPRAGAEPARASARRTKRKTTKAK